MSILRPANAPVSPAPGRPAGPERCDACDRPGTPLETRRADGLDLRVCADWRACIDTARTTGAWAGR